MAGPKRNAGGRMTKMRLKYEATHPERFQTGQDIIPGARNLNNRQLSMAMGWDTASSEENVNHPMQGTLFDDERMVESPPRWEDMSSASQSRVLTSAADYGVTPASLKRALTAQLHRALIRDPNHASFYSTVGETRGGDPMPRERLIRSAAETGAPFHVQAAANAITSPNNRFVQRSATGETVYPNDEAAKGAVRLGTPDPESGEPTMTGEKYIRSHRGAYPYQGYPANMGRAIDVTTAVASGTPIREAWKPGGRAGSGRGDKVRAYHNAWVDPASPEGNFVVSDTHTGGGMAPHIADTEHEAAYLSIAGIHSLHDKVMRDVLEEHGLSGVGRHQSLQWNQEKLESYGDDPDLMRPADPPSAGFWKHDEVPGQLSLF